MSARTAKALRRDIRRAVGPEAIDLIDAHSKSIDHQVLPNINALLERTDALAVREKQNKIDRLEFDARLQVIEQNIKGCWRFRTMSLWFRLRWLVTGQ